MHKPDDEVTKLIDRIRKLLALSHSSNEAEASSALEMAQALLVKYDLGTTHGLTLEAIRASHVTDDAIRMDGGMLTPRQGWQRVVGEGIGIMCSCRYFVSPVSVKKDNMDQHGYIGQRHTIAVARLMFEYLTEAVTRIAWKNLPSGKPAQRRSYMMGCAFRLMRRMKERAAAVEEGFAPDLLGVYNLPALINKKIAVQEQITEFIKRQPGFSVAPIDARNEHDPVAFAAGVDAGDTIGLDPQIGATTPRRLSSLG